MNANSYLSSCLLSVDLEDFHFNLPRLLGLTPSRNPDAAWRGLERLEAVIPNERITFFATGQIARSQPDLIAYLVSRGHEIACHGDVHRDVDTMTPNEFDHDIRQARDSISDASGKRVVGFRAPNFSMRGTAAWALRALAAAGFEYDSSLESHVRTQDGPFDTREFPEGRIVEFPIYRAQVAGRHVRVIGGTYLRLLPESLIHRLMKEAANAGFMPLVYLHLFDVDPHFDYYPSSALSALGFRRRWYWTLRQRQWAVGGESAGRKLRRLLAQFRPAGPMAECGASLPQSTHREKQSSNRTSER